MEYLQAVFLKRKVLVIGAFLCIMLPSANSVCVCVSIFHSKVPSACCNVHMWKAQQCIIIFLRLYMQKSSTGKVPPHPEYGVVYVALEYPPWQKLALTKLRELLNEVCIIFAPCLFFCEGILAWYCM